MDTESGPHDQRPPHAIGAISRLASRLGMEGSVPVVLHEGSRRLSVHLSPFGVVATAVRAGDRAATYSLALEVDIARYLVRNGAPAVGPGVGWPAGPHVQGDFVVAFREFVGHDAADERDARHVASAAEALSQVHRTLASYRGELPSLRYKVNRCRSLLEDETIASALRSADRAFMKSAFGHLRKLMAKIPIEAVPIHGDAHLGNVFITPCGARWNDFEDVCLGPLEWDLCWLPDAELARFEPLDRDLLRVMQLLRSLCVSVWCRQGTAGPAGREAAEYHLEYVKSGLRI